MLRTEKLKRAAKYLDDETLQEIISIQKIDPYALDKIKKPDLIPGIYFLFKEEKLIYIGKSTHIPDRISCHCKQNKKSFDFYSFIAVSNEEIDFYERIFINKYRPILNIDSLTNFNRG